MSDLLTAAGKLRDSREALRSHELGVWLAGSGHVYTADRGWYLANGLNPELAAQFAWASPHVTEALERHLRACAALEAVLLEQERRGAAGLRDHEIAERMRQREQARDEIECTVRALAAAINHTGKD